MMKNETNAETVISVDCNDYVCRTCLSDLRGVKVFSIDGYLVESYERASEGETLAIKDILSRCTSIEVSRKL